MSTQLDLFGAGLSDAAPPGWRYQADFLTPAEEAILIDWIRNLSLSPMQYRQYVARRRGTSFGGHYDFDANRLQPSPAIPEDLAPLRAKVAGWMGTKAESFVHVLVAEYRPGSPLGWHRDVPDFEDVVGVSLGGPGVLAFRRYPPRRRTDPMGGTIQLAVEARSIYCITGPARWEWQHAVVPQDNLRYSITLRTARRSLRKQVMPSPPA